MTYALPLFLAAALGYGLGSIPFGLVLCKMAGLGDIRQIGSGNIGATNVLRTGNKALAFLTLILDSGKGAIAVFFIPFILFSFGLIDNNYGSGSCLNTETHIWERCGIPIYPTQAAFNLSLVSGFFTLVGHCYPVWLNFKGGKGVATTLGTLLALAPILGLFTCVIWLASALLSRMSSLSALIAIGLSPLLAHQIYHNPNLSGLCAMIAALVYLKHRENIKRIFAGQEPKIGKKG